MVLTTGLLAGTGGSYPDGSVRHRIAARGPGFPGPYLFAPPPTEDCP